MNLVETLLDAAKANAKRASDAAGGQDGTERLPDADEAKAWAEAARTLANTAIDLDQHGFEAVEPPQSSVSIQLDGRQIAHEVIRYTLQKAARGPSSLVGGKLSKDES